MSTYTQTNNIINRMSKRALLKFKRGMLLALDVDGHRRTKKHNALIAKRYQGAKDILVAGFWNGHDASCCLMQNGKILAHIELERYLRLKEVHGDALYVMHEYMLSRLGLDFDDVDLFATCYPSSVHEKYSSLYRPASDRIFFVGHHTAHASHAFYSSNLANSMILTIDGGGVEGRNFGATGMYVGDEQVVRPVAPIMPRPNIGGVWSRVTRYVFGLQTGGSGGHQAGTVMAMAAFGDRTRFEERFYRAMTVDNVEAEARPPGHDWYRRELFIPIDPVKDPPHPYWFDLRELADQDSQAKLDIAAGFQAATERIVQELVERLFELTHGRNKQLCISGGVALNSVVAGMLARNLPWLTDLYIPPVPADDGLSLGAAQYLTHHVLNLSMRAVHDPFLSPYLGLEYDQSDVMTALSQSSRPLEWRQCDIPELVSLLVEDKIIAAFHGRSESGRRALGNRSIIASPLNSEMKSIVNEKVKHRQWFRPFAPAVLEEEAGEWFESGDAWPSPYMSFVLPFKEHVRDQVPAVVHHDGSARLQTVSKKASPWFYDLISAFRQVTGVPVILNTSFNDREPIVESPQDAINCFLKTSIDYLYFVEQKLLVTEKRD